MVYYQIDEVFLSQARNGQVRYREEEQSVMRVYACGLVCITASLHEIPETSDGMA